jgi:hypothetical protein
MSVTGHTQCRTAMWSPVPVIAAGALIAAHLSLIPGCERENWTVQFLLA